jgi:hypothetical protein
MLQPHEIFSKMSGTAASDLLGFLHDKEKPLYRATLESLAKQRNLRPVFLERKPRAERHTWFHDALGRKANSSIAAHLLQIWLVGAHSNLLCDFLDGFGISHDANGTIETLPPAPAEEDLVRVVDQLLSKYPAETVSIYLHAFQSLDGEGWVSLEGLLQKDARLALGAR